MSHKYSIFIASSLEGIEVARLVQAELRYDFNVTLWNQGVILPPRLTIESLLQISNSFDFGIFLFTPDDVVEIRGEKQLSVRDNVLFECGLFFSSIGRQGSFFIIPSNIKDFRIPTDLWGVRPTSYDASTNDRASIGPACSEIREAINQLLGKNQQYISLSGEWKVDWYVPYSKTFKGHNISRTIVRHIGNRFLAVCHNRDYPFEIKGKIENGRIITGTWGQSTRDAFHGGVFYFGSFQMVVSPKGDRMTGKSVGFRSNNKIATGKWEWTRCSNEEIQPTSITRR